jgi:gluconolactonase
MTTPALPLESLAMLAEGLDHPEGICRTSEGRLFVGGEAGQIYEIADDGTFAELLSVGGFVLGLAADADGRIYAIDSTARCVWRIDPDARTKDVWVASPSAPRPFHTPNWGAFDRAGNYYLSDSGDWGGRNGCIWRVPAGRREAELWSESSVDFPNGLALAPDGSRLYLLESYPGALVELEIRADGSAGERRLLCDLDPFAPDGVAVAADGALYVACYRPDAIYRWHPDEGLTLVAADPRGTVLNAPTNIAAADGDAIVVPNLAGWHVTRVPIGVALEPLNHPTRAQLGG